MIENIYEKKLSKLNHFITDVLLCAIDVYYNNSTDFEEKKTKNPFQKWESALHSRVMTETVAICLIVFISRK